jgi:hypothetical protein
MGQALVRSTLAVLAGFMLADFSVATFAPGHRRVPERIDLPAAHEKARAAIP